MYFDNCPLARLQNTVKIFETFNLSNDKQLESAGDPVNVAIERLDCNEVLLSCDKYCDFHDDDDD